VVDNYDSFTMNLVQPLRAWGHQVHVVRHDEASVEELLALGPLGVILSPGPNRPEQAGVCLELVRACLGLRLPCLGVCLGHQAIAVALGGRVVEAEEPLHGRATAIRHDQRGVFAGLPSPLSVGRYHSLIVAPDLPAELEATAWSSQGEVMGLRHRERPLEGVQFHPESYLTPHGEAVLRNFTQLVDAARLERGS
jgi:anthranilate synthase/aminodeoxychorismate synthase-like glutamine amidotransferase